MRITLTLLVFIFGLAFADKEEDVIFKDAKVKPVVAPAAPAKTGAKPDAKKAKATVQVAQDRQDSYGAPVAPAADTYGAPQAQVQDTYGTPAAPVQDSYGPPKAPVAPTYNAPAPAPVQGEVGTQGYYYYYYPVASGSGGSYGSDTKTTYSAPSSSSGGGGLGASTGLLIALVVGVLIIGAIAVAATFANNNTGRWLLNGYELDKDELALKVHEAIELYNALSS